MIGIRNIGGYIPERRDDNFAKAHKYALDRAFIEKKIGIVATARKGDDQCASDMCKLALLDLQKRDSNCLDNVDCICVCTQNGDYQLPQTSAVLHQKLNLPIECAAFDISLGCSGYIYALHIMRGFMLENQFRKGLLFTADPYSTIISDNDKNTDLLFGDAATVTLLTDNPIYEVGKGSFGTFGDKHAALIKRNAEKLFMNGREIFNFVMTYAPILVNQCLANNKVVKEDIDLFLVHQASKYVVEKLAQRISVLPEKMPFCATNYGNTVSSSVPLLLHRYFEDSHYHKLLLCGFGVGLSMSATMLRRL
ncbi:MAG: ketoacyl-ACP synthase III [Pseudomonadota bacterium]